jgi:hypothetical protein
VQSCLYKPFSWGYLRNNKQFSERLFRIYPSILSPIFSKGTFSVPSNFWRLFSFSHLPFVSENLPFVKVSNPHIPDLLAGYFSVIYLYISQLNGAWLQCKMYHLLAAALFNYRQRVQPPSNF